MYIIYTISRFLSHSLSLFHLVYFSVFYKFDIYLYSSFIYSFLFEILSSNAINLSFWFSFSRVLDRRITEERSGGGSVSLKDLDMEVSNSRHVMLDNNAIVPSGFNARFAWCCERLSNVKVQVISQCYREDDVSIFRQESHLVIRLLVYR